MYELIGIPPNKHMKNDFFYEYLDILKKDNIKEVLILFGIFWANEIYEDDWNFELVTLEQMISKINYAESQNFGTLAEDDFFIRINEYEYEIIFCHEYDVHVKSNSPSKYTDFLKSYWISKNWKINENI